MTTYWKPGDRALCTSSFLDSMAAGMNAPIVDVVYTVSGVSMRNNEAYLVLAGIHDKTDCWVASKFRQVRLAENLPNLNRNET